MGFFSAKGTGTSVPNGYDATQVDNTLYGSKVINGNNVTVFTTRAMAPSQAAAPYWYGNGSKPATLAGFSPVGLGSVQSGAYMGGSAPMGGGDFDGNCWDPRVSPAPWAIAFLIIGFIGLRQVHWKPS